MTNKPIKTIVFHSKEIDKTTGKRKAKTVIRSNEPGFIEAEKTFSEFMESALKEVEKLVMQ